MRFRQFPEDALGSKVKVKVLLHLLSEGILTSEREVAEIVGVSHMAVNRAMKAFADLNLVSPLRVGNSLAWKVKEGSYAYSILKDLKRLAADPPLRHLQREIKAALGAYGVTKAVIFGSVGERRERQNSDIDLLVIVEQEHGKQGVLQSLSLLAEKCLALYGNTLSPYVLTEKETQLPGNRQIMKSAERGIAVIA